MNFDLNLAIKPEMVEKPISEMTLAEVEDSLSYTEFDLNFQNGEYELISAEIRELRLKLAELEDKRADTNRIISKHKSNKSTLASRREYLKQQQLANQMIQETADRVYEILRDFPAWSSAHDYQKEDIVACIHAYLAGFNGFLNANDMGMGKTFESILIIRVFCAMYEAEFGRSPRILWLTKSSLLKTGGTVREFKRWYPEFRLAPLDGSWPKAQRDGALELINMINGNVITNYETVRTTDAIHNIEWDMVVMDEVHKLKGGANLSGPTGIWKSVNELCKGVKFKLMLSGTPMVNRPGEMWAYLHIFDSDRFPSARQFENDFTAYQRIAGEMKLGVDAEKLLNQALKGRMVLRRKQEVGLELPSITPYLDRPKMLEMLPQQRKAYDQMKEQFFVWMDQQDPNAVFTATAIIAQLIRLRQINIWPVIDFKVKDEDGNVVDVIRLNVPESSKIDEAMEDIEALTDADEQFVLFCTFNEPLYEVQRRCRALGITCDVLAGETSKNLADMEINFQQGKTQVLCINSAMGEGLNLQKNPDVWSGGSSYVGFLDLWYNPARNDQCTDRVWRQGATVPVTCWHYKNESSVDAYIDDIIEEKFQNISGVTEGKQLRPGDWAEYLKGKI